jgi:phosphatidylglycerol lysyltransferase
MTTEVAAEPEQQESAFRKRMATAGKYAAQMPFTAALTLIVIAAGIASEAFWNPVSNRGWYHDFAFGVPAFEDGKYWTPFTGWAVGPTPGLFIVSLAVLIAVVGWAEIRLGTEWTAVVAIVGQLVGQVGGTVVVMIMRETNWEWAHALAEVRGVGFSTAIVALLAAISATLRSPWRLRVRAALAAYVAASFLFIGSLTDLQHLIALLIALPLGEKFLSKNEHGVAPRTRQETRMLALIGLIVIAVAEVVVPVLPEHGPLGPTEGDDASMISLVVKLAVIAVVAGSLWKGRSWAWWVTVVFGSLTVLATIAVIVTVIVTKEWEGFGGVTAGTALLWLVELQLLISGRWAFRVPARRRFGGGVADPRATARELLTTRGGSTMSWWLTWEGNEYHFSNGGNSMMGFQRHVGVVIGLCDPVGPPEQTAEAITDFTSMVETMGFTPCLFSVTKPTADLAEQSGWRSIQIAEDTIVDLPKLAFTGKSWQDVRTAINRAAKEGIEFRLVTLSEEPHSVLTQIREISEEWVGDKGLPEMGFTLGSVEEALDPAVRVALAVDKDGHIQGFLSWLPAYGPDGQVGWTLDLMRRRKEGFRPVVEFLIGRSALEFKEQGSKFVSLSGAPLARSDSGGGEVATMDKLLDTLGAAMEPFYGFRSLHSFKKKFHPRYEPVYMCFRDEADLPRIGIALTRAYLPKASIGQFVKLATSKH